VTTSDPGNGLPIRLLHDRVLVRTEASEGERRSTAGLVIPATASMGTRLSWATAVGVGPHVRSIQAGDRVLFDPDDRSEVEPGMTSPAVDRLSPSEASVRTSTRSWSSRMGSPLFSAAEVVTPVRLARD